MATEGLRHAREHQTVDVDDSGLQSGDALGHPLARIPGAGKPAARIGDEGDAAAIERDIRVVRKTRDRHDVGAGAAHRVRPSRQRVIRGEERLRCAQRLIVGKVDLDDS